MPQQQNSNSSAVFTVHGIHGPVQVAQNLPPATQSPSSAPTEVVPQTAAQTTETVGQPEKPENPLAEHPPLYYTGVAAIAVAVILLFIGVCRSKGLATRGPSKAQSLLEQAVESITWFSRNAIGEGGEKFAPLIGTIFCFILVSNLMGVLPFILHKSAAGQYSSLTPAPTSNLSMTLAIALIVFIYVQYIGIKQNGIGGYIKHFMGPVPALAPLMFPLELVGAIAKPISLSIRLFGNIFGEETVTAVLVGLMLSILPWFIPIPVHSLMLMFGVFGSIVQAGVFTILTCAYLALAIGDHDSHGNHHDEDEFGADVINGVHPEPVHAH